MGDLMKIFGIGLPRTGTTSLAMATMELGFKTCHTCFSDALYDIADAFCDSPIYADYPVLDLRYPGSKFILTWRDPAKWHASFSKNLGNYMRRLRLTALRNVDYTSASNWRSLMHIFGTGDIADEQFLLACYRRHREMAEAFFMHRKQDLLILDLDNTPDLWAGLCRFLGVPRPATPFPYMNAGTVVAWDSVNHPNKVNAWGCGIPNAMRKDIPDWKTNRS